MKRIKKGDEVIVIAGKSKGVVGSVLSIKDDKVIVKSANLVSKHVKANPQANIEAGIIKKEAYIHVSNVAIYNPKSSKADKVGFKFINKDEKLEKVRYFKSDNELIDIA